MDSSKEEKDYLELPFGPPPILPDIRTELKEYIVNPEKLAIHQVDKVQQYWERKPKILSLLEANLTPLGTTLKYERDPITGHIGEIQEVMMQNIGETVRNSMSMARAPGPISEGVKGNASNFLFWPGGFDEPQKTSKRETIQVDFENNLKILAKGFSAGIEFMPDNCTPKNAQDLSCHSVIESSYKKQVNVNLESVVDKEGHSLAFWFTGEKNEEKKNEENKDGNVGKVDVQPTNMDEFIEPFEESKVPVFKISEAPKYNMKTKWAEQIDIMIPVNDFDKKIPDPAMTFPYELDTFQKQAILKLEEQCDVFVAAHTSAGKTTIAEYAIAMSQKHMTRTIYTSPIKALSNQKFREFKEKFENVGLITGDLQIEPTATCLIMTTEILQSMLYCAAEVIRDVEYVIFDEVHYINDEDRGHVWEQVIILLPPTVNIVMLSATVPNPLEFAHWVGQIKRRKMYVISTVKRPVPLQHYLYTGCDKKSKDQLFLLVDKDGKFIRSSIKEAIAIKKEQSANQKKSQQTKYQHQREQAKQKPSLTMSPSVLKNLSAAETLDSVAAAKEEEDKLEDQVRQQMITAKDKRMWVAFLDHLQSTDKLPVVIFILSRNRCDKTADAFSESLLNHAEQRYVGEFFNKSIRHLKGTDSQLPQVRKMQRLLKLGIGVHHSGILPILKEIVEMLFQKGMVKVLFATETFAMGVNMPAKTVVFDSWEKYDGNSCRNLLPTEYIQMAGRAGRRGHDETGTVIILCKKKVPEEKDLRDMVLGAPQNLESKFKVTYSMILHLKRLSETISVGDMMRRSFKEVKTWSSQKKNKNELEKISQEIEQAPPLAEHQKEMEQFYDLAKTYVTLWKELRPFMLEGKKAVKSLVEGRVLLISYRNHYNKLGILLGFRKKTPPEILYQVFILTSYQEEKEAKSSDKTETYHDFIGLTCKKLYHPSENPTHDILIVPGWSIVEVTNCIINVNCKMILADWDKRQIPRFKDAAPGPSCVAAMNELTTLSLAVQDDLSVIQPFLELKIQCMDIKDLDLQNKVALLYHIYQMLKPIQDKLEGTTNLDQEFCQVFKYKELEQKKQELLKRLGDEYLGNYPEYESRLAVLKELDYIDREDRVTLKGRVALEMGTCEIFLTELVLDNVLTNWQPEEIAAMMSSLVFQHKINDEEKDDDIPRLNELKKEMTQVYEKLAKIEMKYYLDPIAQPSFQLIRVVYEWARQMSFANIMKLTDIQEGIIVRCIQQLNETLQDVRNAAIIIGHPALKEKMEEASTKIKRDIVFTASLYTQD
ncbi:hypothetical protein TSAR_004469 [Trichomalopsis sarcophagae]|uniref:Helicase ATP-binding domain-containing protein n=1 Tax=Trichomalopsis sarcophagae TaxID=543379 RepID=A0A232F0E8_9HYME|nr:hypothetical protein TSAR_004469 [Trichomalopsis sarcophagae]